LRGVTLYLHIGMQKTGSSSLENAFAESRPVLATYGIDYPDFKLPAHHELAWALQGARKRIADPAKRLAEIGGQLASSKASKIVLSSEDLCGLKTPAIAALAQLLPAGHDVRIVCYFRHPIDWVEAQINQKVKSSHVQGVGALIPTYIGRTDYFSLIERWAAVFGADAIRARVYRSGTDVIADFLQVIETDPALPLRRSPDPINVSLSEPLIRIKQVANRYGHSRALRRALNDIQVATNLGPRARFLSPKDTTEIAVRSEEPLRRLWEKYIDKDEPPFDMSQAGKRTRRDEGECEKALQVLVEAFAAYAAAVRGKPEADDAPRPAALVKSRG
jgi:hypothetical protein